MSYYATSEDRRVRELQAELEGLRYEQERAREEETRRRETAQREREERAQEEARTVRDWPEAFRKGRALAQREALQEARFAAEYPEGADEMGTFFQDWVKELNRAAELYREEEAAVEEQVRALQVGLLERVAIRLEQEGFRGTTPEALRGGDPSALVEW